MGVMDKFLNAMRLNSDDDDYDYEEDEYYESEAQEEPVSRKKSRRDRKREEKGREKESEKAKKEEQERFTFTEESGSGSSSSRSSASSEKVTPLRSVKRSQGGQAMEVCVMKPTAVDDAREITETLLSGRTVILNFEGLDLEIAQRIIDFTSGATFAVNGNLQKISTYIFIITPSNVDISGDFMNIMDAFEASSLSSDI